MSITTSTPFITPDELATLMATETVIPIDVRDPEAYAAGHLPGAVNLPEVFYYLATTDPEGLKAFHSTFAEAFGAAGLTGAQTAVLYEDGYSLKAPRGYWMLEYLGYPRQLVLQTGYQGWVAAGHDLSAEATSPVPGTFPLAPRPELIATQHQVLAALEDPHVVLLDCRDREEWESESSSPYGVDFAPRKGRIPGAVWMDWNLLLTLGEATAGCFNVTADKGVMKELAEIDVALRQRGVTPEKSVILYCFKGARTSSTYLALKQLGYPDVRNYLGSWNEWSRDPALPIQ
jgi:thiosulfate/3-mercaptopyruvate sulfurtransferase